MSRIYDNKVLKNLPLVSYTWSGVWDQSSFECGKGVIAEGSITARARIQIAAQDGKKVHFLLLHIKVCDIHRRQFDASGQEIEPNFSNTGKVRTGFLNSSYKVEAKGHTDKLGLSQLKDMMCKQELNAALLKVKCAPGVAMTGSESDTFTFWIEESAVEKMEFQDGDIVRLKTRGDGPFIASISKLDNVSSTVSNYAGGEQVGASWTDKVMNVKVQDQDKATLPQDAMEGVDDDEWDD